jgi:hypothetical protein
MKKTFNYPELWQQKRNELPVYGDPDADWLEMQAALDKLMPVIIAIKKPYNPKGLKGLYKLFIGFSTAAVIYGGVHYYFSKKQKDPIKSIPQKSVPAITAPVKKDSVILSPQAGNSPLDKPGSDNNAAGDKAAVVSTGKNNALVKYDKALSTATKLMAADSVGSTIKDNGIVRRDSALSSETPLSIRQGLDSAGVLKAPIAAPVLDNKAVQKSATGSGKTPKKKKHRIQISL